jgi:probable phosphoglycerate mutase
MRGKRGKEKRGEAQPATQILYFVRHGQTDWNAQGRLQGQLDIAMNARGESQVRANGRKLAAIIKRPEDFLFVASPMGRTRRAMEMVRSEMGLAPHGYRIEPRLREMSYGEFAGHKWDELRRLRPREVARRFADPWEYVVPGGENYKLMARRVESWLAEITTDKGGGNCKSAVIATHAGIIRIIRSRFLDVEPRKIAFLDAPQDKVLRVGNGKAEWL